MTASRRNGASLVVALAAMVLIQCVVLGTLHLALLERQLAAGSADVLRLRLGAGEALARASAAWPSGAEALLPGGVGLAVFDGESPEGLELRASLQRIGPALYLLRSTASRPAPGHGRASAELLLLPPVLPPDFNAADWTAPSAYLLPGTRADSLVQRVVAALPDLDASVLTLEAGAAVDDSIGGVVVAAGDLRVTATGSIVGMLFVAGTLHLEDGAELAGAVIAGSFDDEGPGFRPDAESAEQAVVRAGLRRPRPAPGRARIPAF